MGAAQLYLKDNFLLEEPLERKHIKKRILGHWGTVPGINFIYGNINIVSKRHKQEFMLIVGPGHGYPALLSNLYMEGTMGEFYPDYKYSKKGFEGIIRNFSWPGGFPSHANPETPGVILEGGELGYSLSSAFGACFDNPDLIVACVIGDGEAETGPLSAAWQSAKFINPAEDGAVLPIVHVNKYKISGPTLFGTMSDEEISAYLYGQGYDPIVVSGDFLYEPMITAMEDAYQKIKQIQDNARAGNPDEKPRWPAIALVSKKGWTGPKEVHGKMIEDSFRSHGVPLEHVHEDDKEFEVLKSWLESYNVKELVNSDYSPIAQIQSIFTDKELLLGNSKHANGGAISTPLNLPNPKNFTVKDGELKTNNSIGNMFIFSRYLEDVTKLNTKNFRVFSPDETESNKLGELFDVTKRRYYWPVPPGSENISKTGRVMEILSEHTLQGWLEGYTLTGRHGIFITYEAFGMIVASMIDQYTKFLKQSKKIDWRKPVPSLNIVLTSTSWRQDHNGFSHQNPGLISSLLNDYSHNIRVHFPVDANMMIATAEEIFKSTNVVNLVVVSKRELPQYLTYEEAKISMRTGINAWDFVGSNPEEPDVIFAATGDTMTKETLAAIQLLKEKLPELHTRFISVSELTSFGIGDHPTPTTINNDQFTSVFGGAQPIIYSYHGYPDDIKQLVFNHPHAERFHIHGYQEKGTTTTPFDILVVNKASRYDLAIDALEVVTKQIPQLSKQAMNLISEFSKLLEKHKTYIAEHGEDMEEVTGFKFRF